jgi:hypothetical protein
MSVSYIGIVRVPALFASESLVMPVRLLIYRWLNASRLPVAFCAVSFFDLPQGTLAYSRRFRIIDDLETEDRSAIAHSPGS